MLSTSAIFSDSPAEIVTLGARQHDRKDPDGGGWSEVLSKQAHEPLQESCVKIISPSKDGNLRLLIKKIPEFPFYVPCMLNLTLSLLSSISFAILVGASGSMLQHIPKCLS